EVDGERYHVRVEEETRYIIRTRGGKAATGGQVLKAPMPGKVVHIEVEVGQAVHPGDGLIVLEAMKMENEFREAVADRVREILMRCSPPDVEVFGFRAPAWPAQRILGGGFGRGAKPPSEWNVQGVRLACGPRAPPCSWTLLIALTRGSPPSGKSSSPVGSRGP